MGNRILSAEEATELIQILKKRFEKNINRHKEHDWNKIQQRLENNPPKLWSLKEMERTGGEPDVVAMGENSDTIIFVDCSSETPKKRRSICYDQEALDSRKEFKPANSAVNMASEMGIELLNEQQYRTLQTFGNFDVKTSSWIKTPDEIRKLGGALFCDRRYNHVFTYHNGAESYYAVRGFRGLIRV
jgi:hypothetical protein